jgi:RAC serine/threonine-protein kinase
MEPMETEESPAFKKLPIKMGWLEKKGEHLKLWRRRFLVLYDDGVFNGYKAAPSDDDIKTGSGTLENLFNVKNSQIIRKDECEFILRCKQQNPTSRDKFIERHFKASNRQERDEWADNIEEIYERERRRNSASNESDILGEDHMDMSNFNVPPEIQRSSVRLTMESFKCIKVLGRGTFGSVHLVYRKDDKKQKRMAMKTIKKSLIRDREQNQGFDYTREHMKSERQVLTITDHPFLIKLYHAFQTSNYLCLVMEFAEGGEIYHHLSKCQQFNIRRSRLYAAEITSAFQYLHGRNIIYRDLKLENLLLDAEGHIKITDFGLSKILNTPDTSTRTFCGTPEYLAPEVLDDDNYGFGVDWWSLGVVLHEMIVGRLPFYSQDQSSLFDAICNSELPEIPQRVPTDATDFLKGLLRKNPQARLGSGAGGAEDVMNHPFFSEIDWAKLYRREIKPEWVPHLTGPDDVNYFDSIFTRQEPQSFENGHDNRDMHEPFPGFSFNENLPNSHSSSSHQETGVMA